MLKFKLGQSKETDWSKERELGIGRALKELLLIGIEHTREGKAKIFFGQHRRHELEKEWW
jgi:hypothetical protein